MRAWVRLLVGLALLFSRDLSADFRHYGGGPEQMRYSPLTQITPANVSNLRVAWTYDTHDAFEGSELQCQPVIANGVLYATSPKLRVFALDAATGVELWTFNPLADVAAPTRTRIRGLMYWERGDDRRIFFAARHWLYALDGRNGQPIESFGQKGRIDLREGFKGRDGRTLSVGVNTPGVFFRDLLILGSIVPEGLPSAPGDIRAFDVHTGRLEWSFHTIPHPGEFGYDTWPRDAWTYSGGANAWAGLALDERRGFVYAATGSASYDFYGANRAGDNLFANSILCLRADTGARVWHFQAIKHDVWDRDFPAPPSLITIHRDGRDIDVVAQVAKNGRVYVLDRDTGHPIFPMETVPTPASDIEGERLSPTQVLPTLPPPFTRQRFTEDLITARTLAAEKAVRDEWLKLRHGGEFDPPSVQGTILFPGMDGGGEWGGTAFDPKSGLLYVNANEMAWRVKLSERKMPDGEPTDGKALYERHCASCHRADLRGTPPEFPSLVDVGARHSVDEIEAVVRQGGGRMPPFVQLHTAVRRAIIQYVLTGRSVAVRADTPTPFDMKYTLDGYIRFTDPDGLPAVKPPWGTLTAIDMNKASIAWQVPLGEIPGSGLTNTGSENYGGPVVTASGLVFIGATNFDKKFHAFNARSGELLWETTLPAAGNATPAVYEVDGKEYVVIAAGGGKGGRGSSGGSYVAFALPDGDGSAVADRVMKLTRSSTWKPVASVPVKFKTFHPQGLVKIGETLFVSSVETRTNDRQQGTGHLFKIDANGNLLMDLKLGEGPLFHPGGIDYDGHDIWVPVAEYRPDSRSVIYRVDPGKMTATEMFRVDDHIGAIVHNTDDHTLHGVSWGSRFFYRWTFGDWRPTKTTNSSHYIDYQDCKYVGARLMLCTGVADLNRGLFRLGGMELVNLVDGRPVHQVPIELWTASGLDMTHNPVWVEPAANGLRAYFMPEDDLSTLYEFQVELR